MTSQMTFNVNNIAKNINSVSSPDPISGIYVLQEWNHCWATVYTINYIHRLHRGPLFSAPLCILTKTLTINLVDTIREKAEVKEALYEARSLHPGTGTDSNRVTRLTTYCREHAPSLANVVSTTLVRPPGTLCRLTYMTLLTLTYSRNNLKLFCLIVCTDLLLLLYGAPGRFVEWHLTNLSLYLNTRLKGLNVPRKPENQWNAIVAVII